MTANPGHRSAKHKKQTSLLPDLTVSPHLDSFKGPLDTAFFRRHRLIISSATLFAMFLKTDVIPSRSPQHKDKSYVRFSSHRLSKSNTSNLPTDFCTHHILHFLHISANFHLISSDRLITLPENIKENLQLAFRRMDKSDPKRITKRKVSEQHLASLLEQKGPFGELATAIAKAIFRKNPALNEDSFLGFMEKYILTHDRLSQLRLCFDVYAENENFITTKMMFKLFRSQVSEMLEGDVQPILKALQEPDLHQDSRTLPMVRRRPVDYAENWKETLMLPRQANALNFRDFTRILFPQRFPDLLLVISYMLVGQPLVDFLCSYFDIPDFKVLSHESTFKIVRWSLQHQVYEARFWEK